MCKWEVNEKNLGEAGEFWGAFTCKCERRDWTGVGKVKLANSACILNAAAALEGNLLKIVPEKER